MEYMPVVVFGRFVPLFWKQLLDYTPFCITESFICCSLGYFRLENAKKLDGHVGAHSILVNTMKTTFSLWKSAFFSQKCQKSLFCPSVWPQTQIFGFKLVQNDDWNDIKPKQKMGQKFFSESVSPFLGRHSLKNGFLHPWTDEMCLVKLPFCEKL